MLFEGAVLFFSLHLKNISGEWLLRSEVFFIIAQVLSRVCLYSADLASGLGVRQLAA
jgi:hypothetical protein